MIALLVVMCIIFFVLQISMLIKEIKQKKKSYWSIYFSSLIAELISLPFVYGLYMLPDPTWNRFAIMIGIIFGVGVINSILIILGIVFKFLQNKTLKKENKVIGKKQHFVKKILLTFVVIWGSFLGLSAVTVIMPRINKTPLVSYVEKYTADYMTKKYGDGDFKVLYTIKEYSGGLWEPEEWTGFYVRLSSSYVDQVIGVFVDGTTASELSISYDGLLSDLYTSDYIFEDLEQAKNARIEKDFNKYFNISIKLNFYSLKVPDGYGRVPTKEELVELKTPSTDFIEVVIREKVAEENRLDYLKKLAQFSINYFNTTDDIKIFYDWKVSNDYGESDYIKIIGNDVKIKYESEEYLFTKDEILKLV